MLITFYTRFYPDVVMFGDVGLTLLRGMGLSERVPGVLRAEDIPAARAALEDFLRRRTEAEEAPEEGGQDREDEEEDEDAEPPVPLRRRALPLLEMLDKAEADHCDILWK